MGKKFLIGAATVGALIMLSPTCALSDPVLAPVPQGGKQLPVAPLSRRLSSTLPRLQPITLGMLGEHLVLLWLILLPPVWAAPLLPLPPPVLGTKGSLPRMMMVPSSQSSPPSGRKLLP